MRSTIVIGGIQALRAHGYYDRYLESLAPEAREPIASLVAGVWIPAQLAVAHYWGADRLGLDRSTVESIGAEIAERVQKSAFSAAADPARKQGVTPWKLLAGAQKSNDLNWRGSDIAIYEEGPRQALYEWTGQPCASVPYFVASFGGYMVAVLSLGCSKAVYRVHTERCTSTTVAVRFSWVS